MTWMGSKANIAAITALNVAELQDGIVYFASTEKAWLVLEKTNTTATANNKSCFTANGGGRWFLSRDSTVVTTTVPIGAAATGTRWIYQEGVNSYDSVISYQYNGSAWIELDARVRTAAGTPASLAKTPNSNRESWLNTTTGVISNALNGAWVVESASPSPTPSPTPAPGTIGINQTLSGYLDYEVDEFGDVIKNWIEYTITGFVVNQPITITLDTTASGDFEPYLKVNEGVNEIGYASDADGDPENGNTDGITELTITPTNAGFIYTIIATSYYNNDNSNNTETGNFVLSTVSP
jgi:hypothetical protein